MYSDKKSILHLIALLKAHGIENVVLSPGSRNAAISHSLASDPDFTCYSVVDERSAGFFALGIIQATGKPAVVCCTSGTAGLNLASAVAEAFYQGLPLLVVTADRPTAWIGQMDGQTIPQQAMYHPFIRHSVQLPEVKSDEDEWYANRLINEAILALDNQEKGPAHINIPLSEPLFSFTEESLPYVRVIKRSSPYMFDNTSAERYVHHISQYDKRMIIIGQLPEGVDTDILEVLAENLGFTILCEHLANVTESNHVIKNFDSILYTSAEKNIADYIPQIVITIGGHIVSKRLKQLIRSEVCEHWHISPSGNVVDLSQNVTEIIQATASEFVNALADTARKLPIQENSYKQSWTKHSSVIKEPKTDFSDLYAAGELIHRLPSDAVLHVANSSSVRIAQLFDVRVPVCCNRGTNGIDGSLSTAVGYAAASYKPVYLLIGDLSFFYDINGLWNRHIGRNLRILLNNNGGGEIFSTIHGLKKSDTLPKFVTAEHQTNTQAWATQAGLIYLSANNSEELDDALNTFTGKESEQPMLLEVFSDMKDNTAILSTYYRSLK